MPEALLPDYSSRMIANRSVTSRMRLESKQFSVCLKFLMQLPYFPLSVKKTPEKNKRLSPPKMPSLVFAGTIYHITNFAGKLSLLKTLYSTSFFVRNPQLVL